MEVTVTGTIAKKGGKILAYMVGYYVMVEGKMLGFILGDQVYGENHKPIEKIFNVETEEMMLRQAISILGIS